MDDPAVLDLSGYSMNILKGGRELLSGIRSNGNDHLRLTVPLGFSVYKARITHKYYRVTTRAQYFLGQEQTITDATSFRSHRIYTFLLVKFHRIKILPSDTEGFHWPVLPDSSRGLPVFASTGTDVLILGWPSL